jgi:hypothetical protein
MLSRSTLPTSFTAKNLLFRGDKQPAPA